MALEYRLKPEAFGWLAQIFEEATPISPFCFYADRKNAFDEEQKDNLIRQGIIDESGNLSPQPYSVFKMLAGATSYARVQIIGVDAPVDKIVYSNGVQRCSMDAMSECFSLTYPPLDESVGFALSEYTGTSRFINVPFNIKLSVTGARTFLLALDVMRQRVLKTLTRLEAAFTFTISDLLSEYHAPHTLFHLSKLLDDLVGTDSVEENAIEKGLSMLVNLNLVVQSKEGWLFTDFAMSLATQLLIPEYHFNITHGAVESDTTVVKSECYVSVFGIHDLLYIDQDNGDIVIETMNGTDLYMILMNAMGYNKGNL